ncbi:HugZ family protein [Paraburkholderia sp. DHOC27]|uniref:HugZ family pyridoxamine 5'-phosphate oxidase n=1 Tax=Paraburkholderia sp. DHOC27 TaxID=2303330 RepID=UPI000E3BE961|nr:pyridoxamine 5'-phosphate oxidase family protein [Paraburkholderia sp. DHOC27]RFU47239.1 pyridoxamine 5'-phosphate oxidase [Paraburkholderia sp. DHOC27]
MHIPAHAPLHLLHQAAFGTLATHSRQPEGFPYPSILPFAPDARHRPMILVSSLAEHTRNLLADPRAGFLVAHAPDGDVLNGQRVTLLGAFEQVDPTPEISQRYLRYHPDAERYLALGDFAFWVMSLERMRYIGGFGAMGWLDGNELDPQEPLAFADEQALLGFFAAHPQRPSHLELLGVDHYGADLKAHDSRMRLAFDERLIDNLSMRAALEDCMTRHMAAPGA